MSRSSSTSTVGSANTADTTTSACSTNTDATTTTTTATTTTTTTISSTNTTNTSTSTDTTSNSRNSTTTPISSSNSTGSISSSTAGVRRVGKYEVGRTLGEGTFAKVKYAINTETGESVALKVLDKDKILQHKMVDQIKREISIMKLVRHPNIVRLHEVLASRTKIYIVLEFVTGGELFDRIVHLGRIGEEESRRYFQQLIDAVEFCHSKGVYHRDLKPENLLLDTRGNLKISDFGLSALPQQVRDDGLLHTTCGTPNYVAPEVLSDKGYDGAMSDLWSCGVILFVLLAGFLPFDEPDLATLYRKIQKAEYRCPPWFCQGVARLIARILDPNPKTRYRYADIRKDEWFQQGYVPVRPLQDSALNLDDIDAVFSGTEGHEIADSKELTRGQGDAAAPFGAATASSPGGVSAAGSGGGGALRPETMNAFELITLSRGLDLGVLFERRPDMVQRHTRFASRCPAEDIVFHVERAAKELRCAVTVKNFKMRLESREPRVGGGAPLAVAVQVFLVAPGLFMVEVWKVSGNLLDFHKFYRRLYALVKDVVWKSEADLDDLRLKHTKVQPPSSSSSFSSLPSASPSSSSAAAAAAHTSRPTSPFTPRQHAAMPKSPTSPSAASTASASVTAAAVTAAVTAAAAVASAAPSAASDFNHPRRLLKSSSSSSAASVLRVRMRKLPSFVKL